MTIWIVSVPLTINPPNANDPHRGVNAADVVCEGSTTSDRRY